jgi:hypothetical protein
MSIVSLSKLTIPVLSAYSIAASLIAFNISPFFHVFDLLILFEKDLKFQLQNL